MQRLKQTVARVLVAAAVLLTLAPGNVRAGDGHHDDGDDFPAVINLPNGHRPEGIAIGKGKMFYAGSLANGSVYAGDVRTGEGATLVPPETGRALTGLYVDERHDRLFAAGAGTGKGFVFDTETGATLAEYQLAEGTPTFVNDVVVTRNAAYFTDSNQPVLYRLPFGRRGALPDQSGVERIPLSGDYVFVPGAFNANGIEATENGRWLIIVHSTRGELYRVDPRTGATTLIDLGGASVSNGDGIRLRGRTLYVVRNRLNEIAVIKLSLDLSRGTVTRTLTDPNFDVPTTIGLLGDALYAVNARFSTPPTPDTAYTIVRVSRK
ncbi:MAG: superoxide dismutase [Chloroflexi bacterium]|nr:superoxide dismutase [Chloroflexota bacterium]